MKLKTGKLNQRVLLAAVLLFLAAAVIVAVVTVPEKETVPETAYTEVEGTIGTVRFAKRTTTAEEYQALWAVCDDCRKLAEQAGEAVTNNTVVVSEETFVDTGTSEEVLRDSDAYVESEVIYLEGLVIARYASQWGDHLTCAACYDENGAPLALSLDGLELEGLLQIPEQPKPQEEDGVMDENTFLYSVKGCVIALLFGDVEWGDISSCFTESGAAALRRVGQAVGGTGSSGMEALLCGVGSTSSTEMLADRIYFRCLLQTDGGPVVLDILLKLNNDLLVYDVDLM